MHELWRMIVLTIVMLTLSIIDIRYRKIPFSGIATVLIISVVWILQENSRNCVYIMMGCIPGMIMLFISVITRRKVGVGDGLLVMALGLGFGMENSLTMLMIALFLCCVVSGALFVGHKVDGKSQIPFVPFITLGMEVVLFAY